MSGLSASDQHKLDALLAAAPVFGLEPGLRQAALLEVLKAELALAADRRPPLRRYFESWPIDFHRAQRIADLPFMPVGTFKANPPLALIEPSAVSRTLTSSSTTGQTPSRVVLDAETAKRMTKGVMTIIRDFIGSTRRPYLVIDTEESLKGQVELGARGAAIQGLRSFATEVVCCLRNDEQGQPVLDEKKLMDFVSKWHDAEVLVYGFTYVVWQHFVLPLQAKGVFLNLPNIRLLHSGGWKRLLDQAVTKDAYARGVASIFGCAESSVIDFFGMVENVGVIYPDCAFGNKHVPAFAEVIVRDPLTLEPVPVGKTGVLQICSVLPTSYPGFLVLTDDMAEVMQYDGCPCGRRGTAFRFVKRVPKAEVRGCGNIETLRKGLPTGAAVDV